MIQTDLKIELLDLFNEIDGTKMYNFEKLMDKPELSRYQLCLNYAYAVPDITALNMIKSYGPIIELGAGKGYWAKLLNEIGTDIVAIDNLSWWKTFEPFFNVQQGDEKSILEHPDRTLFLCWPPFDTSFAHKCLKLYSGEYFIYVGESKGGCTGTKAFFNYLDKNFDEVECHRIPQWFGIHDFLTIYKRRQK